MKKCFTSVLIACLFIAAQAQTITKAEGDTIWLKVNSYAGPVQWQESLDSNTWTDISGATYQPFRIIVGNTTKFYRMKDNCYGGRKVIVIVLTTTVSSITTTTASSGGNITSDGGAAITARGVCWSTSTHPTIANSKTTDASGPGIFTSSITGLILGTAYYVRSYATNSFGTVYGNQVSFTTSTKSIGDSYQGGIVAYCFQPGDPGFVAGETHGLIAAPSDQGTVEWGCYNTEISGADGTAIGTGNQNTIDIMNGCATAGIAARLCGDLVLNGYSDWYLPSIEELNKLYVKRIAIGGFGSFYYWSSSEFNNDVAQVQNFGSGGQNVSNKSDNWHSVRCVRGF